MQKTIESIKNQTFTNFEVWILDANSPLETQNYLNNLEKPFFYQSSNDNGIYDAMNKGITLSKGKWLYFLGTEDVFFNDTVLEYIFNDLSLEKETIVAGKIVYQGKKKPFIHSKNKMVKEVSWSNSMWIRNGLHHQGTFYKKALFKNKKYDLKYKILSDYWFNLYLFKNKVKCKIIDIIIAKCNSDGVSKSGSWSIYQEEINLKKSLSSLFFKPFFYIVAVLKYISRKIIND